MNDKGTILNLNLAVVSQLTDTFNNDNILGLPFPEISPLPVALYVQTLYSSLANSDHPLGLTLRKH